VQTTILLADIVSVTQGNLGPCSLLLETTDKRFDFSLLRKDEMLSWKDDICSRIPLPLRDLNVQTLCCKQDYEEEEIIPDVEDFTAPSPDISIPPPAYSPVRESENAMERLAPRLNEAELARKEAELQAKERDLERREEEVRRKETELQLEKRSLEIDYHRRLKEVESFYQLEMERDRGPPQQRPVITPYNVITVGTGDTSKDVCPAGPENPTSMSVAAPLADHVSKGTEGQFVSFPSVEHRSCPEAVASTVASSSPNIHT
jgi:hypothetical protein